MDDRITYAEQFDDAGTRPIDLVNVFTVAPGDVEDFLAVWADDAAFMKRQPGFIRAQLHRGIAGSTVFVNIARWESPATLRAAFTSQEFRAATARYPAGAVASPHVCTTVAVPGICTT
jgi:heme-degrading monooxygenase HmoA